MMKLYQLFFLAGSPVNKKEGKISPDLRQLSWKFYISWWTICKSFTNFETCVSVNDDLCEKLVSSLDFPVNSDERFTVTSVPFFIKL